MESILDYIRQIEEVKATEEKVVEKSTGAETKEIKSSLQNVWRKDEDEDEDEDQRDTTDLIYSQFPDSQDGFVKVKKIL